MTDVLKLAEEALEMHRLHVQHNHVTYYGEEYNKERQEQAAAREYVISDKPGTALTALRAARAEWGWQPIAEMEELEVGPNVLCGKWIGRHWAQAEFCWRKHAVTAGYTHFYRPQLPSPPTREEVGNA